MDNVSHSLTAVALSRAGLNRLDPLATPILLISGNVPDIDFVTLAHGSLAYLEAHRGYTHSLIALPVMAVLSVLIIWASVRRRVPFVRLFWLASLGVASHLFLDWTNSYGVRFFLPWSSRWFHLDLNALTDYLFLAVLLMAFVWPHFERLVTGEIGSQKAPGRAMPMFALSFFVLLDCTRAATHAHAIAELNAFFYDDQSALQIAALPRAFDPFAWRGVVETSDSYRVIFVDAFHSFHAGEQEAFRKLPRDSAIDAALTTEPFRYFQYFARFPVWSEQPASTTSKSKLIRVEVSDLRFSRPGDSVFSCWAIVDGSDRVLRANFAGLGSSSDARIGTK